MSATRAGAALLAAAVILAFLDGCGSSGSGGMATAGSPAGAAGPAGSAAGGGAGTGVGAGAGNPQPSAVSSSPGGMTSGSGSPGAAGASATCRPGVLTVKVDASQAGAATGSTYYPIDFTNTSAAACALDGFPGVALISQPGRDGRELGTAAQQNDSFDPVAVQLNPGGHAHAWLQVGATGAYPAADCQPTPASWLRVYPPGERNAGYARVQMTACAAPGAAQLAVMPVRAGLGSRGATP